VAKHWRSIAATLLLLAALAPLDVLLDVWRVWEDWTLAYWGWAVNLTNDILLLGTLFCLFGALMCVLGRRAAARNLTVAALTCVVVYIVGYTLLTAALLDTSIWAAIRESVRYWVLGIGYDEVGVQTFYPSQIFAGPVSWVLTVAALVVIVRAGKTMPAADASALQAAGPEAPTFEAS
jgi:hypothetical protein